jgi:hypothetical protein
MKMPALALAVDRHRAPPAAPGSPRGRAVARGVPATSANSRPTRTSRWTRAASSEPPSSKHHESPWPRELPREFTPAPPTNFSGPHTGLAPRQLSVGTPYLRRVVLPLPKIASLTMHLALRPGKVPASLHWCREARATADVVLGRKQPVTLRAGLATIAYIPLKGDPSPPEAFAPPSLTSFVDRCRCGSRRWAVRSSFVSHPRGRCRIVR